MGPRRRLHAAWIEEVQARVDTETLREALKPVRRCRLDATTFSSLVRELEVAATDYRLVERCGITPLEAARALAKLAHAIERFEPGRRALEAALIQLDGRSKAVLLSNQRGREWMQFALQLVTITVRSARLRSALLGLRDGASEEAAGLRRSGRPRDVRRRALAVEVALALTRAGVKPTTNPTGALAACLPVVFEAAGAKVPKGLEDHALLRHAAATAASETGGRARQHSGG